MPEPFAKATQRPPQFADTPQVSMPVQGSLDVSQIMASVDEVAFSWDLARDEITFDGHGPRLFALEVPMGACSGAAFQLKIAADCIALRQAALIAPPAGQRIGAEGTPYRVTYTYHPQGRANAQTLVIEEEGLWWAASDGTPLSARGVMRIVTKRFEAEQQLRYRGDHDALTGQLNRTALLEKLQFSLERSRKSEQPVAFLLAAVNGLDVVNETFGFETGDEMLAATARLLRHQLRAGDHLGRYASNKFGIVINECGPGVMRVVADRLMAALRATTIATTASRLPATLAIGGICLTDPGTRIESAVANALQALDRARRRRLDSFVAFEPSPEDDRLRRRNAALASSLVSALDENRLRLELQPIVDAKTGKPEHYECLLRMDEADGSAVSAGEFMPIAEQLGLSRLIDLRTLDLAVRLLVRYPAVNLSLNVSGLTSADNEWLVALHRATAGNRQLTGRLTIEITETAAIGDLDQSMVFVDTIKEMGCHAAIDDFGVGYTNFRNLKQLNADFVKIDGVFVKNVCNDAGDQVFVKSMVELARAFGMKTVAEWVGDAATARFLTEAGIDYLQGYHFGAPAPPEKLLG